MLLPQSLRPAIVAASERVVAMPPAREVRVGSRARRELHRRAVH
jgi:hypothetical protein